MLLNSLFTLYIIFEQIYIKLVNIIYVHLHKYLFIVINTKTKISLGLLKVTLS